MDPAVQETGTSGPIQARAEAQPCSPNPPEDPGASGATRTTFSILKSHQYLSKDSPARLSGADVTHAEHLRLRGAAVVWGRGQSSFCQIHAFTSSEFPLSQI